MKYFLVVLPALIILLISVWAIKQKSLDVQDAKKQLKRFQTMEEFCGFRNVRENKNSGKFTCYRWHGIKGGE